MLDHNSIFTEEELSAARSELAGFREQGGYREGHWMVSPLNRRYGREGSNLPERVIVRDISLRTMEQMPGVVNSPSERLQLLKMLAEAGVPEVVVSAFRRGHTVEVMREQVEAVANISSDCKIVYANAVSSEELKMASDAGVPDVQIWSARFLGRAMPISAGAVYHRVWQEREWRNLNFPQNADEHFDRSRRLISAAVDLGLRTSSMMNMITYADEDYVAAYATAIAEAGAYELILADSSGGTGPEAMAALVRAARDAAPELAICVHAHNAFGLAVGTSLAGVRAGAQAVEVAINGYETGPGGVQAGLATTVMALEAMYETPTGIELSALESLYSTAEDMSGWPRPWSEPLLGRGFLESASADEYDQETKYDRLIHGSVVPEILGAEFVRQVGWSTGPFGMWDILSDLGIEVRKEDVLPIRDACLDEIRRHRRPLSDAEIRDIATRHLRGEAGGE